MCMSSNCMCYDCQETNEERTFYEYSESYHDEE